MFSVMNPKLAGLLGSWGSDGANGSNSPSMQLVLSLASRTGGIRGKGDMKEEKNSHLKLG